MAKFASGKKAFARSDRCGQRYLYRLMSREWNGLLVGPDEYEPKQPQLGPFRTVNDPQALQNARPDRTEPLLVFVGVETIENPTINLTVASVNVGSVTVVTS